MTLNFQPSLSPSWYCSTPVTKAEPYPSEHSHLLLHRRCPLVHHPYVDELRILQTNTPPETKRQTCKSPSVCPVGGTLRHLRFATPPNKGTFDTQNPGAPCEVSNRRRRHESVVWRVTLSFAPSFELSVKCSKK